ncbi:MAG: hypothetical protein ACE1ZO_05840 [Nitrospirales bacterium]
MIAEDDAEQLAVWRRDVIEFNQKADRKFTFVIQEARTAAEAREILAKYNIDCAIIDLRLPPAEERPDEAVYGNELRAFIENELPIPAAIHTAYLGDLDEAGQASIMKTFTKDAGQTTEALEWFAKKARLMEALANTNQRIKKETAKVLHASIWPRWEAEQAQEKAPDRFDDIVTRQVVSHLTEKFSLPLEDVPAHHLHEFYHFPPMRERLHTGDLVRNEDAVYVIVTPQCDIVNDYPTHFLLAKCLSDNEDWKSIEDAVAGNNFSVSNTQKDKIRKFATHARDQRTHFLPPCGKEGGPWIVDFKEIITVEGSRVDELLNNRFASIAAPFVPNLVHRFAAFIGRIGQPELDVEVLGEHIASACREPPAD